MTFEISVVVPSFNCANFLERAVASVQNLGLPNSEILLVDDGSTDETPNLGPELAKRYPALSYLRKPNGGLSSARNFGMASASGRYIVLLDADDELLPCEMTTALATGADMVRIGVLEAAESGATTEHLDSGVASTGAQYLQARFNAHTFFTPSWAYFYRRDWLQKQRLQFKPGLVHEDNLFTVQALLAAGTVAVHPGLVYKYIRRPGSITKASDRTNLLARIDSLALICEELTGLANSRPDLDLRWWIDQNVHNAAALAKQAGGWWPWVLTVAMQLKCMVTYRGFQRPGVRHIQRKRLKALLLGRR